MCYIQRYCDLEEQITCHRYRAHYSNQTQTVYPIKNNKGRYGKASTCDIVESTYPPRSC